MVFGIIIVCHTQNFILVLKNLTFLVFNFCFLENNYYQQRLFFFLFKSINLLSLPPLWGVIFPGYYQGPPVMAPPQYAAAPPRREPGFLEGW
jgi:hypothetical protein